MRAVCILLRAEDLQDSSFERAADILLLSKSWRYSSFYTIAADILLPSEALKVFFLWKSCSYSSSFGRAAGIILLIGELHVIFFL